MPALKLYYQTKYKFSIVVRALNAIFVRGLTGPSERRKNCTKRKVLPRVKIFTFFHYRFRWTLAAYIFPPFVHALSNFLGTKQLAKNESEPDSVFFLPSISLARFSALPRLFIFHPFLCTRSGSGEFPCTHIYLILKI